jgi:fructokinase
VSADDPLIAGVELGGTKGVALIARGREILARSRRPTQAPEKTLGALADDIATWSIEHGPIDALGIASFGPIGLDPARGDFGSITRTAKPGWSGARVFEAFRERFAVPIGWDTDVAGAALAETMWGAGLGQAVVVYLTIGTGIGGGLVVDGRPVHGLVHPEMGHLRVRRAPGDDFAGICPFHGDCAEGLASGPAIAARAGAPAETLPEDHPVWPLVAGELAELAYSLILTLSPNRILIGGGVTTGKPFLLPLIRAEVERRLGGYVAGLTAEALATIVRAPALGDLAGPLGAVALGLKAMQTSGTRGAGLEAGT